MTTWNSLMNIRNPIYQIYDFYKSDGNRDLLAVSDLRLWKEVAGDLVAIPGALDTNTTEMITYKDRSINDVVLIADGGELKQYNGTNVTTVTPHVPAGGETTDPGLNDLANLTTFRHIALKKDRIYTVAHPTVKNRVHFSFYDPVLGYAVYDYFPAIYFFDVATESNDEITALRVFRDQLIIFCKRSVWALKGDGVTIGDVELVKINVPTGCIATNSIQEVGNNLFFLGGDHVYSLFSTERDYVSAERISDRVLPILNSIGISDKTKATSGFMNNKYYLNFPTGHTLVYDIDFQGWSKYSEVIANYFLVRDGILYFSSDEGYVFNFADNVYSDNGDLINFQLTTKITDIDAPQVTKKFRKVWVITKQFDNFFTSYDLEVFVDQFIQQNIENVTPGGDAQSGGVWDVSNWDESSYDFRETFRDQFKIRKKGKDIQFRIGNDIVDQPFTIFGFVIEYQTKNPVR